MRAVGVIAEFNPFHNGHAYLLEQARKQADVVVVVMSGTLAQRGEPALFDKWTRARAALLSGADMVLELPAVWSCASAEGFARAGAGILCAAGCQALAFGCESDDIDWLSGTAKRLSLPETDMKIRAGLREGLSYAAARERALGIPLRQPNDILAVEYLRAVGNALVPIPIRRTGAAHDGTEPDGKFASASWIRSRIRDGADASAYLPHAELYQDAPCCDAERLERAGIYTLRGMSLADWKRVPDTDDGLAERLYRAAGNARSLSELCALAKTRRHALARIRRAVLCAIIGITRADRICASRVEGVPNAYAPPYIRALGMNGRGERFLRETSPSCPFGFSLARLRETSPEAARYAQIECRAWDWFSAGCREILPRGVDFTAKPIIMKEDEPHDGKEALHEQSL